MDGSFSILPGSIVCTQWAGQHSSLDHFWWKDFDSPRLTDPTRAGVPKLGFQASRSANHLPRLTFCPLRRYLSWLNQWLQSLLLDPVSYLDRGSYWHSQLAVSLWWQCCWWALLWSSVSRTPHRWSRFVFAMSGLRFSLIVSINAVTLWMNNDEL